MAIINSLAIGKSVKSAGNLTYKTVRGRTIASQRITSNASNTPLQQSQRAHMREASSMCALLRQYIDNCYEKSKFGSARNNFMHINTLFSGGGVSSEVKEGAIPLSDIFIPMFNGKNSGTSVLYSVYGTSSVIAMEKYAADTFQDTAGNNFNIKVTTSIKFTLPMPVKEEELTVCMVGFVGEEGKKLSEQPLTVYKGNILDWEPDYGMMDLVIDKGLTSDGLIQSLTVYPAGEAGGGAPLSYVLFFPVVSGKYPKLSSIIKCGIAG